MKRRCQNPDFVDYPKWGGRGITVCDEWSESFESFNDWAMNHEWKEGLTLDRIDNDKGYCPENCRWATVIEQANNKRNCTMVTYGDKTQSLAEWARESGLPYSTLLSRISKGWDFEKAINTPKMR
jgi:hypothetical protein